MDAVVSNPDLAISAASFNIVDQKGRTGATGHYDPATHTGVHTRILMYSLPDEAGLKTRYKLNRRFIGRRSRRQFSAASPDVPTALSLADIDMTVGNAESMNLESDERDVNGRLLFSEANAEILTARLKRNGETVRGFMMNGQFVTDEDASAAPGGEVAGKEGMKWAGRRSWDKQEKAEKLRVAIRKSLFFQHVNARTIQYYTSYQAGEEYTGAVRAAIQDRIESASKGQVPQSVNGAIQLLMGADPDFSSINPNLIGPAIAGYVTARTDPGYQAPQGVSPFPAASPEKDKVIAQAISSYPKEVIFACLMLLSQESDPKLWTVARAVTKANRMGIAVRTQEKLDYLPKSGELMRMALLEELAYHQSWNSEFDADDLSLTAALDLPGKRVLQEELDSRRGTGNWFKRNLLNGNIVRHVMRAGELGVEMAGYGSDVGKGYEKGWGTREERDERRFWFNYAEGMSDMTSTFSLFSMMITGAMALDGGAESAAVGRDLTFDAMNISEGVSNIVRGVREIGRCVARFNKWRSLRKPENAQERRETLDDRDLGWLSSVLKALDCFVACVGCARDIASIHVTAGQSSLTVKQSENWGELLRSKGILDKIITNIRRIIRIIDDIREIVVSARRIGRIDLADTDIETAISAVQTVSPEDFAHMEGRMELRKEVRAATGEEALFETTPEKNEALEAADRQAVLGQAARENSQAQYLMALTRKQSKRNIVGASFNIATNVFEAIDDVADAVKVPLLRVFTLLAPKAIEFAGWITTTSMDRNGLATNIERMLGGSEFGGLNYPYFDEVLKRETGIVNKHYLTDLARIFASIDTHAMIKNPEASPGELELGMKVVGTMMGNVNEDSVKHVELLDLMRYAGVENPSSWRAILRNSLMA